MAGDIFYSSVDKNLQSELTARATAGFTKRRTKDLDFMLGKVSNVEIRAYDGAIPGDDNIVKDEDGQENHQFGIIGGKEVTVGSYLPTSQKTGFLVNDGPREGYRIPPVITLVEINIGDHSMGLLNKASINITIPDPTADFDEFEKIWFRPGRHATVILEYPDSGIVTTELKDGEQTGGLLDQESLPTTTQLEEQYPEDDISDIFFDLRKMNRTRFDGVITSFTFTYQTNGSVECTISMTGTSNVYTEVSMLIPKEDDTPDVNETKTLYTQIKQDIAAIRSTMSGINNGINYPDDEKTDQAIMWGELYPQEVDNQNNYDYITLGYLINSLNNHVISKLDTEPDPVVKNPKVVCNDTVCKSRLYEFLVSADPSKIFLFPGKNNTSTVNKYPDKKLDITPTTGSADPKEYLPKTYMANVPLEKSGYQENKTAYPSRIFIGVETVLKPILEDDSIKTVNDFLKKISATIYKYTGGAVKMALISHPQLTNTLLYYDSKYLGDDMASTNAAAFIIPMFAKEVVSETGNTLSTGTIVLDAKISAKLPASLKNLSYALNQGTEISTSDVAPFVSFMYAEGDIKDPKTQRGKLAEKYKSTHEKFIDQLRQAKALFTDNPESKQNIKRLQQALVKYIQYPTDDISESNKLSAPIYPFEVELTIEGINGFKYGDVVHIPALPERYRTQTIFSVINVVHTVEATGIWNTKLKLIMRPNVQIQ